MTWQQHRDIVILEQKHIAKNLQHTLCSHGYHTYSNPACKSSVLIRVKYEVIIIGLKFMEPECRLSLKIRMSMDIHNMEFNNDWKLFTRSSYSTMSIVL